MCPIGFLMLGSTLQDLPSDSPGVCRSACRGRRASPRTGSHQRTILACTRPVLVGHAVELAMPNHLPRRRPGPNRRSAGPAPPAPASSTRLRLRQTTSRAWTQRATTPTPAIPAVRRPAHAALQDLTSAGHSGRGNAQTPDARTGRWTRSRGQASVDTGRSHRTPDTGRWPRTRTGDDGAAGIRTSWATTPSDRALGRPTVFLWTAPAALGSPCRLGGEAAFQREMASRRQLLGRPARVERRLGALLSSDDYGSSVEPTAKLHPLWRWEVRLVCTAWWGALDGMQLWFQLDRMGAGASLVRWRGLPPRGR
jgi:hypothetical protein